MKKDRRNIIIFIAVIIFVVFSSYFLFISGVTNKFKANVNRLSASIGDDHNSSFYPVITMVINSSGEKVVNEDIAVTITAKSIYKIDKLYYSFDLKKWNEETNFKKDYSITCKLVFTKNMNNKLYIKVENEKGYVSYPYETILNIDKENPIIKTSNFLGDKKVGIEDNNELDLVQYSNDKVNWVSKRIKGKNYTINNINENYKYIRVVDKAGNISKVKKIGN